MESEKKRGFIINFVYYAIILFMVYVTIKYGFSMLSPFILAFAIASLLKRPSRFLARKLKISKRVTAILLVLLFYSTMGIFISLLGFKIFISLKDLVLALPTIYAVHIEVFLHSIFNDLKEAVGRIEPSLLHTLGDFFNQFTQSLGQFVSTLSISAVGMISNYATSLPALFIKGLLMVISTFFIAADYEELMEFVYRQFPKKVVVMIKKIQEYVVGTLFVCIRSYAIIMGITFVELSLGFLIIGVDNAIQIAFIISVFDIIPILGTGGIIIPWAIISTIQGNYQLAVGLLIIYAIVIVVRYIVEPRIVGRQIGLHPVVALISMFVGLQLFGILGLFGFPILLSLLRYLNDTSTIKLFK